ncbi:MAG: hypothetical protein HYS23_00330 [Geobacter sp.]|nr:hypothetical protein [Geobacter sp.]
MIKDDTKAQISLFEIPAREMEKKQKRAEKVEAEIAPKKKREQARTTKKPAEAKLVRKEVPKAPAGSRVMIKPVSGLVPEGDVRLTANIRQDLHLKLKIEAAHRRTTIGDLIEELVERYL